jgi:hypothetical protein
MGRGEYLHLFLTSALDGGKVELHAPAALSYRTALSTITGYEAGWVPKRCGEETNFLPLSGIEPRFIDCPARCLVALPIKMFRLHMLENGIKVKLTKP